jgi:transposase
MIAGIERLTKRLEEVRKFEPTSVTEQFNIPHVERLSAAIDETLVRTFGADSADFDRYRVASQFDNGPFNYAYQVNIAEVQRSLARSKDRNIALIEQAIEALKERLAEVVSPSHSEQPSRPESSGEGRKVFVVHGHSGVEQGVARFLEQIGFEPIIPTALAVDSFWDSQIRESLTRCRLLRGAASMGAAVSITRLDVTAAELRMAAGREKDGSAARRMLAIAMILDGADRKTAAETCGMDRQTLRDWVHRYNAEGMRGLHDRKTPGPEPKLTADQQAKLAELVETGPDPARHGVVRWRRVDLRDELERRFGVVLHERSVGKVLAKLGYCRLSVRPRHPQTDEAAQEAFKKTSPQRSRHGSPTTPKTSPSKSGSRTRHASASKAR